MKLAGSSCTLGPRPIEDNIFVICTVRITYTYLSRSVSEAFYRCVKVLTWTKYDFDKNIEQHFDPPFPCLLLNRCLLFFSGGSFGGTRGARPVPPEKGVFPLDHLHECDLVQFTFKSFIDDLSFAA